MHERGFGILLIAFSLPLSVPLPYIPGVTTILAIPLCFLSGQMILAFDSPWLPKWITRLSIKKKHFKLYRNEVFPFAQKNRTPSKAPFIIFLLIKALK